MVIERTYRVGLIGGFLFGTVGIFVLAALSLISSFLETLFFPLLQPGKWIASVLIPATASPLQIGLLYIITGVFYACVGLLVHIVLRALRHSSRAKVQ